MIIIYNLNNYIQYKHVWNFSEVGCLMAFYRLDRKENLLEIFPYPSNNCAFYGP